MPVETVGILIDVGLQVERKMVDAPHPCFEQDHRPMKLAEVQSLPFGFFPDQLGKFAFQAFIAVPPVCPHLCNRDICMSNMNRFSCFRAATSTTPSVDAGNTFPFMLHGQHHDLLLALVAPREFSSWPST